MFETIKLFLGSLSWQWKLAGAGALLAALTWYVLAWGNKQYYQGLDVGRTQIIGELNDQITEENRLERERLAAETVALGQERLTLDTDRTAFTQDQKDSRAQIEARRGQIDTILREETIRVTQIPDSELDGNIRLQLERLRTGGDGSAVISGVQ